MHRPNRLIALVIAAFVVLWSAKAQDAQPLWRTVSRKEIEILFSVARQKPPRCQVIADIDFRRPAWTDEQVDAEISLQEEFMQRTLGVKEPPSASLQAARRAAIKQAHSESRIVHVEEWYSGGMSRIDETDDGLSTRKYAKNIPEGYFSTYVNIRDPSFSKYTHFSRDHVRKVMQVTTSPGKYY